MTMKNLLLGLFFCCCLGSGLLALPVSAQGYLRAEGEFIVNDNNEPVLLRGMGLGGWMLQEGYMLQLGKLGQQHVIRANIEELIGAQATQEFYDAWLANHVTKADIDAMARWGFNSVRLPMHFNLYTLPVEQEPVKGQNTWLEQGFAMTDALVAWAKANNMYVILDLHAAPGGQGNDVAISDRDPAQPSLWQSEANQQKTIALWRKLAERYANEPWVGAYDLINEPNWGFEFADDKNGCKEQKNTPLRKLMVEITEAIRAVDRKHMIIIEGNCWGNNYAGVLPQWDDNMALSFHKYWNENNLADISAPLKLRKKYNIPLWLGESGENSNLWFTDAIRLVESQGIGWAFWPLKKMGFNNPLEIHYNAGFAKLLDYWNGKGERPSAAEAKKALMTLATKDIHFAQNEFHPDVIDAMFRQPHSAVSLPYKSHSIKKSGGYVSAAEYDMGLQGKAYQDTDSANYHVSTGGERTPWNRGEIYRNDGVDLAFDAAKKSHFINSIEAGEWVEYTIEAEQAGRYSVFAQVRSSVDGAKVQVSLNQHVIAPAASLTSTTGWQLQKLADINLLAGANRLRVTSVSAGYELMGLQFKQ